MFFKKNKVIDERIQKRSNELSAQMFPICVILELVFLIIKISLRLPIIVYLLDICILAVSLVVWLAGEIRYGTLSVKEKDDILKELSNKAKMQAFMAMFKVLGIGELLYIILVDKEYFFWVLSYFACWFPVALYITIKSVSEGLIIFGSKKKEKNIKKDLAVRTFIGSIFFGLFMGYDRYIQKGVFNPKGLIAVPLLAAGWGIPFYLIFVVIMKIAEKNADKKVEKVDIADEK